ncbi:hypothetical protein ACH5RR_023001 [Cinchona calisaya]|uniref:CCHC-type domain-containing protein n=1 Tax=Cinchona calisaya TaxID=153742 RepID=A0ABD2ZAY6_9GENT
MSVEDLILRLRIEKDNKMSERKASPSSFYAKANMVEQVEKSHKKNHKKKHAMKGKGIAKKFKGKCYSCNKVGHLAEDCKIVSKHGKSKKGSVVHVTERLETIPTETNEYHVFELPGNRNSLDRS